MVELVKEQKYENEVRPDGVTVKRTIYIVKHIRHSQTTTEVVSSDQKTPSMNDELVGMEVLEEITEIPPEIVDVDAVGVGSKTTESYVEDTLPNGAWLKRTVRCTSISRTDKIVSETKAEADSTIDDQDLPDYSVDLIKEHKEESETKSDGTRVRKQIFIIKHVECIKHTIDDSTSEKETSAEQQKLVGMEIFEDVTETAPEVCGLDLSEIESVTVENKHEDTLPDGAWVERTVKLTTIRRKAETDVTMSDKSPTTDVELRFREPNELIPTELKEKDEEVELTPESTDFVVLQAEDKPLQFRSL